MTYRKLNRWQKRGFYAASFIMTAFVGASAERCFDYLFSVFEDVRPDQVDVAKDQTERIWERNSTCLITAEPTAIPVSTGEQVTIHVCPTGDILLSKSTNPLDSTFFWVTSEKLDRSRNQQNVALLNLPLANFLIAQAYAAPIASAPSVAASADQIQLAQGFTIICVKEIGNGRVLRRIKLADGTCVDQIINTFNGTILENTTVTCDSTCG
jgi:hypothetical protein